MVMTQEVATSENVKDFYLLTAWESDVAQRICKALQKNNLSVGLLENCLVRYADGGTNPNLPSSIRGKNVFLVVDYQEEMGNTVWQACQLLRAAKKSSARERYVIEPCFRCGRGDKVTGRGMSNLQLQIEMYELAGATGFVALDLHNDVARSMTSYPFENLSMLALFEEQVRHFSGVNLEQTVFLAPDYTAQVRYGKLAERLEIPVIIDPKTRDGADSFVREHRQNLVLDGKTVVLFDDICSTGNTLATAVKYVRERGAQRVCICVTHGATAELCKSFTDKECVPDSVVVTNSLPEIFTERLKDFFERRVIDIVPLLAETIKTIYEGGSLEPLIVRNS
jgi:ribose-phosphate pyrophosphokinase